MLPQSLAAALAQTLGVVPHHVQPIGGGDINHAARFVAGDRFYLVKWNVHPPVPLPGAPGMFAAEAMGLARLAGTKTLRVPTVYAFADGEDREPAYILLEWIEPARDTSHPDDGAALGRGLAALHRATDAAYGLEHDNYCGATPQINGRLESWIAFFGERRLGFQMELATQKGHMNRERRRRLERLIARLGEWIDEAAVRPSLLHGDLWGGNWMTGANGEPVIYDPAIYYGDREAELAMCHLFGGFPDEFFRAYDEAWPPDPGRDERLPLYQLYHLLNHLNLFGEGYGSSVDRILRRYVG